MYYVLNDECILMGKTQVGIVALTSEHTYSKYIHMYIHTYLYILTYVHTQTEIH